MSQALSKSTSWPEQIFGVLKASGVHVVAYVPDAGHAWLIQRVHEDNDMRAVSLTSEEEGIAVLAGAWLGGKRGALLVQSSGVGNCVNMLSLVQNCRFPLLSLVTMRGEWGEFNPWQVPMGRATAGAYKLMGVEVLRADSPEDVEPTVSSAARFCYEGGTPVAVLLSQRLIGAKDFAK